MISGGPDPFDLGEQDALGLTDDDAWLLDDLMSIDSRLDLIAMDEGAGDVIERAELEPELRGSPELSQKWDELSRAARNMPTPAVVGADIDTENWDRQDESIVLTAEHSRGFWRKPRSSFRLRVAVAGVLLVTCIGVFLLSVGTSNGRRPSNDLLNVPLPTATVPNTTPVTSTSVPGRVAHPKKHPSSAGHKSQPGKTKGTSTGSGKTSKPGSAGKGGTPAGKGKPPTGKGTTPAGKGKSPTGKGKPPTGKGKRGGKPTGSSSMTAAVAKKAFDATWPEFAAAANSGSTSALDSVATPSVVLVATATHQCGCMWWPTTYQSVRMTAPVELSYPYSFAAEIDLARTGSRRVILAVLEQSSKTSPWLVSWVTSYNGGNPTLPAGSTFGAARGEIVAGMMTGPIIQLAALFEALRTTGSPPPNDIWDGALGATGTEPADTAAILIADHTASVADHRRDAVSYQATNFSTVFPSADGYFACGEIDATTVERPPSGSVLVQPPDRSSYGPTLAPGSYSSVTADAIRESCVDVSSSGVVSAAGLTGGLYSVTGTAA